MAGEVTKLVADIPDLELVGIVERKRHPDIGKTMHNVAVSDDLCSLLKETDVLVEFTSPEGLSDVLDALEGSSVPLISGTTGLSDKQFERLKKQAMQRAVLWSPNMSVGVNLLFRLAGDAARLLSDYDVELVEMHHRHKKDAPSGTARRLAEIVNNNRRIEKLIYGREGHTGERKPNEMGVFAMRGGDVAGEHTLYFATEGERIELTHRAASRLAFARGTLRAIRFIASKPKGFYQFSDILEDK